MSWGLVAAGGGALIGGAMAGRGAKKQAQAAEKAAKLESEAAMAGIEEQKRQFDEIVQMMSPYLAAGGEGLEGQRALLGLAGGEAQAGAIRGIEESPEFAALIGQGEEALLQGASATGGLRGGNIQGALAQFRPEVLSNLINQRFQNLGFMTGIGQSSAGLQAAAGQRLGEGISAGYGMAGAARAGGEVGQAAAEAAKYKTWGDIATTLGGIAASKF